MSVQKQISSGLLNKRNWIAMFILAVTGQIAWAVENTWFNTFVFDEITKDPGPIATMVAVSAIVATLTTLIMGTLSDESRSSWGRRKPFILFGYILWGVMTALFPMSAYMKAGSMAVFGVVALDALMTFFGSTANDAAFNAWTADITPSEKRGKVEGMLSLALFIAQLVSLGAAGILIENAGYFAFFYSLGGLVILVGIIAGALMQDAPLPPKSGAKTGFFEQLKSLFNWKTIKGNQQLFVIFFLLLLVGIGMQVSLPYFLIYLEHNLGYDKSQISLVGGAMLILSAGLSILFGWLADRINKRLLLIVFIAVSSLGCAILGLVRNLAFLGIAATLWQGFSAGITIVATAWLKDLLPEDARGQFMGVRMIFVVLLPMLIGPSIGSALIRKFGVPASLNGEAGFIPAPVIFFVGAVLTFLAILPCLFLRTKPNLNLPEAE